MSYITDLTILLKLFDGFNYNNLLVNVELKEDLIYIMSKASNLKLLGKNKYHLDYFLELIEEHDIKTNTLNFNPSVSIKLINDTTGNPKFDWYDSLKYINLDEFDYHNLEDGVFLNPTINVDKLLYVNKRLMSFNPITTLDLIKRVENYHNIGSWDFIALSQIISFDDIVNTDFNWDYYELNFNKTVTFKNILDTFYDEKYRWNFKILSKVIDIKDIIYSTTLENSHLYNWDWDSVYHNNTLTYKDIIKYQDKIDFQRLSSNTLSNKYTWTTELHKYFHDRKKRECLFFELKRYLVDDIIFIILSKI